MGLFCSSHLPWLHLPYYAPHPSQLSELQNTWCSHMGKHHSKHPDQMSPELDGGPTRSLILLRNMKGD